MARSEGQKLKLLYLNKILLEESDRSHPLTASDIIDRLGLLGIPAERKTVYADLELLRKFGVDVVKTGGRSCAYYIGKRDFELPELKLLVDAVQSSKFITVKKSEQLITKLEGLASRNNGRLLQHQVYVSGRIKTMNESIYYNVDKLSDAISRGRKISFSYYHLELDFSSSDKLKKSYRKPEYITSPFVLIWDNENYYLIAFDEDRIKHYRIDKMEDIQVTEDIREGDENFKSFDAASYSKQVFGMFGGKVCDIKLKFENSLAGVAVDRFGKDVFLAPLDRDHFTLNTRVVLSPQFFSWIFGLGSQAEILFPAEAAEEYRKMAENILSIYKKEE